MDFQSYVDRHINKFEIIKHLFGMKKVVLSFDKLRSDKVVDSELLYVKDSDTEDAVFFVFGFNFFIKELSEQEFKKYLGQNVLNFKIYKAYYDLKNGMDRIKVSDILNKIQNKRKDSVDVHRNLRRIMSMAYYLGWELEKDVKDLEGDYFISIPDEFLVKIKQRYNFEMLTALYENQDLMVFLNTKGKINVVFKDLDVFSKKDVEMKVVPSLKHIFNIKSIDLESE